MNCQHLIFRFLFLASSFVLLLSPYFSFAEQKNFPAKEIKSIVIKADNLDFQLRQKSSGSHKVQWTGGLSVEIDEGVLKIQSRAFNSSRSWNSSISEKPAVLKISGPSRPLQLFSFSSNSSLTGWTQSVFLSSFKGEVKAVKNKGPWEISLREGSVDMDQQEGSVAVQAFRAQLKLNSGEGDFRFRVNEGSLRIKDSEGQAQFTTDKADVRLIRFKGRLTGSSQSGNVRASIQPEEVDLFADEGALQLYFLKYSPRITAHTSAGKIYGGRTLHKKFSGKSTTVSGRLRGSSIRKGNVSLKTETGNIYIN